MTPAGPRVLGTAERRAGRPAGDGAGLGHRRRILGFLVLTVAVLVVWEAAKWLGGDPWRLTAASSGSSVDYEHAAVPLADRRTTCRCLMFGTWSGPSSSPPSGTGRRSADPGGQALFTFQEALVGFAFGSVFGLALGILFVHSRLAERALVPYVVASQAVPILAISPLIVIATQAGWLSVAVISAYLTFFPVTIAALRGLRAADPRALELFHSYAATRRQVLWNAPPADLPAVPLRPFRIGAAAAVIRAIIGELPAGIANGLGSAIVNYNQYYVQGPERLWATIIVCSCVGLAFVGLVRLTETLVTRGRYRPLPG